MISPIVKSGILLPLMLYPVWEAAQVRLNRYSLPLPELPNFLEDLQILFLSDLHITHLGRRERRLQQAIKGLEVDLLLVGGDVARTERGYQIALTLLSECQPRWGRFLTFGNSEYKPSAPTLRLQQLAERYGFTLLLNQHTLVHTDRGPLVIIGVDDPSTEKALLTKAMEGMPEGTFRLLLSHSPEIVAQLTPPLPHLILCGHTHSGQIRLPFLPPLYGSTQVPSPLEGGFYPFEKLRPYLPSNATPPPYPALFLSRGVGTSFLPIRLLAPPEVAWLKLVSKPLRCD